MKILARPTEASQAPSPEHAYIRESGNLTETEIERLEDFRRALPESPTRPSDPGPSGIEPVRAESDATGQPGPRHEPRYASKDPLTQRRRSLVHHHGSGGQRQQDQLQDRKRRSLVLNNSGCTIRETAAALGYTSHSHVHGFIKEQRAILHAIAEAEKALAKFCSLPSSSEATETCRTVGVNSKRRRPGVSQEPMTDRQRDYLHDLCEHLHIAVHRQWLWYSKPHVGALIGKLVAHLAASWNNGDAKVVSFGKVG